MSQSQMGGCEVCFVLSLQLMKMCNHRMLKKALECLEAMIGGDNPEHFFVVTQDTSL